MSDAVLELRTRIAARPSTVFRYFTDPERFGRWMGAAMGTVTVELREGGALRVEYPGTDSAPGKVVLGEIVEIVDGERLAFTWGYENDERIPAGSSRVEITLAPFDQGTVLTLRHSGLPSEADCQQHRGGWRIYTSVLASGAAAEQHGDHVASAVDGWFAAWAETDAAARAKLLTACCEDDVEFRDAFACLGSLDDLSGHVTASQAFSQGVALETDGSPTTCHDLVRFGWKATMNGRVVATGVNVGRLSLEGRWSSVHGFRDAPPES